MKINRTFLLTMEALAGLAALAVAAIEGYLGSNLVWVWLAVAATWATIIALDLRSKRDNA